MTDFDVPNNSAKQLSFTFITDLYFFTKIYMQITP